MPRHTAKKTNSTQLELEIFPPVFDLKAGVAYVYECSQYGPSPALHHLQALCQLLTRYPEQLPGEGPIAEPVIHEETWSLLIRATLAEVLGSRASHWVLEPLAEPWVVLRRAVRPQDTPDYLTRLNIHLSDSWRS